MLIVSAVGEMVSPMCIFWGVRNMAVTHLTSLPKDGKTGTWSLVSTKEGFITSEKFVLVLQGCVKYLEERKVQKPVILFVGGAQPHINLA